MAIFRHKCESCGATSCVDDTNAAPKCEFCGQGIQAIYSAPSKREFQLKHSKSIIRKNTLIALLLCFFLGYLGIHKFYENKAWIGLLYLFTGGLFFVGYFVDIIIYIVNLTNKK